MTQVKIYPSAILFLNGDPIPVHPLIMAKALESGQVERWKEDLYGCETYVLKMKV